MTKETNRSEYMPIKEKKRTVTKGLKENKTKRQGTKVFINKHIDKTPKFFQLS